MISLIIRTHTQTVYPAFFDQLCCTRGKDISNITKNIMHNFHFSEDKLKLHPKRTEAITAMPALGNRELQIILGMLTYLNWLLTLSQVVSPLRTLLEIDVEWYWQSEQE